MDMDIEQQNGTRSLIHSAHMCDETAVRQVIAILYTILCHTFSVKTHKIKKVGEDMRYVPKQTNDGEYTRNCSMNVIYFV